MRGALPALLHENKHQISRTVGSVFDVGYIGEVGAWFQKPYCGYNKSASVLIKCAWALKCCKVSALFKQQHNRKIFFREYVGELRIISLRRKRIFKVYNTGQKGAHAHLNQKLQENYTTEDYNQRVGLKMVGIGRDNPITIFTFTLIRKRCRKRSSRTQKWIRTYRITKTNQFERICVENERSTKIKTETHRLIRYPIIEQTRHEYMKTIDKW